MNAFEYPNARDPFDNSPRFDPFALFAFCSVIVLIGAMGYGIYAGPLGGTRSFELPDIFGTKAQDQAQKLLMNIPLTNPATVPTATATAVADGKTGDTSPISASVPAEAAEPAITVPWGLTMGQQAAAAPAPASAGSTEPQALAATDQHAVGSRHKVTGTSGDGVFIRRTPKSADRITAWPDNTIMEYQGEQTQNEGITWAKMKDPAGNTGWVPVQYLTPIEGSAPPAAQPVQNSPAPPVTAPAPAPAGLAPPASGVQVVPQAPAAQPIAPSAARSVAPSAPPIVRPGVTVQQPAGPRP